MRTTEEFIDMIGKAACAFSVTTWNTYTLACRVIEEEVPGVMVECGVYAGAQIAAMWRACQDLCHVRPIHAFDSFQGCPEACEKDDPEWQAAAKGKACSSRENFEQFMTRWGVRSVTVHEGWFEDTIKPNFWGIDGYIQPAKAISLLRLDGDLYSSTLTCLKCMYPHVSPGGYVIIDDYALGGCKKAVHEYFGDNLPELNPVIGGGGPVWFRKAST